MANDTILEVIGKGNIKATMQVGGKNIAYNYWKTTSNQ
jgi:hypothetical protein